MEKTVTPLKVAWLWPAYAEAVDSTTLLAFRTGEQWFIAFAYGPPHSPQLFVYDNEAEAVDALVLAAEALGRMVLETQARAMFRDGDAMAPPPAPLSRLVPALRGMAPSRVLHGDEVWGWQQGNSWHVMPAPIYARYARPVPNSPYVEIVGVREAGLGMTPENQQTLPSLREGHQLVLIRDRGRGI